MDFVTQFLNCNWHMLRQFQAQYSHLLPVSSFAASAEYELKSYLSSIGLVGKRREKLFLSKQAYVKPPQVCKQKAKRNFRKSWLFGKKYGSQEGAHALPSSSPWHNFHLIIICVVHSLSLWTSKDGSITCYITRNDRIIVLSEAFSYCQLF